MQAGGALCSQESAAASNFENMTEESRAAGEAGEMGARRREIQLNRDNQHADELDVTKCMPAMREPLVRQGSAGVKACSHFTCRTARLIHVGVR